MSLLDHIWPWSEIRSQQAYIERLRNAAAEDRGSLLGRIHALQGQQAYMPLKSDDLSNETYERARDIAVDKAAEILNNNYMHVVHKVAHQAPRREPIGLAVCLGRAVDRTSIQVRVEVPQQTVIVEMGL